MLQMSRSWCWWNFCRNKFAIAQRWRARVQILADEDPDDQGDDRNEKGERKRLQRRINLHPGIVYVQVNLYPALYNFDRTFRQRAQKCAPVRFGHDAVIENNHQSVIRFRANQAAHTLPQLQHCFG